MAISVVEPIGHAIDRTKRILFQPFKFEKWLVMGFCAFLATLGQGGSCFNIPSGPGGGGSNPGSTQQQLDWLKANWPWLTIVVAAVLIFALALGILLTWIRCRGVFMFLDGIVRNRAAVVQPWKLFRPLGNSMLLFLIAFGFSATAVALVIAGLAVAIAWPDIQAQQFGGAALIAAVGGGVALLATMVVTIAVTFLLEHFVVPTMYLRRLRVMDAWSVVRHELLPGNGGKIFLYFLMRWVVAIAVGIIALVAVCATCCIGALPYISSVLLLPLFVFDRAYALMFLEQFGPAWQFFARGGVEGWCAHCGYDLRATPAPGLCPECGTPIGGPIAPPLPGEAT